MWLRPCLKRAQELNALLLPLELEDGTIVTGKTSDLLGASAAVLLNAIKVLGDIPDDAHLIAPSAIEPDSGLKDYVILEAKILVSIQTKS
ncbi:MAG: hypothetical protein ACLVAV_07900 [Clostridium sp.]